MTNKIAYYSVSCDILNMVLKVKILSEESERKLFSSLTKKVKNTKEVFSLDSYKEAMINSLILGGKEMLEGISKTIDDANTRTLYINHMFQALLKIYTYLDPDFLCGNSNIDTFLKSKGIRPQSVKSTIFQQRTGFDSVEDLKEGLEVQEAEPSPGITLSSIEEINAAKEELQRNILGQDEAIDVVVKYLKLISSGMAKHASLLFVGQTGTGKTELCKVLGRLYGGNFFKINCAEYAGAHEYAKLIGAPPGYLGHSDQSLLGEKANKSNQWVLLFDEIEKANSKLFDFLLSVLDDGTCTDNLGRTLDFTKSIFVFTSNQGISDVKYDSIGFGDKKANTAQIKETILKSVKDRFSPEFLNRIDASVCFNSLTQPIIRGIAQKELESFPITITDDLVDYVVTNGFSAEYGARNIRRFIKDNIAILLADELLARRVPTNKKKGYVFKFTNGKPSVVNTKPYVKGAQHE